MDREAVERIEDLPVLPEEAVDLPFHVEQCVKRQVATVREIRQVGGQVAALRREVKTSRKLHMVTCIMFGIVAGKALGIPVEQLGLPFKLLFKLAGLLE